MTSASDLPPTIPAGPPSSEPPFNEPFSGEPVGQTPEPASVPPGPPVRQPGIDGKGRVRRTRISGVWVGLVAAAVFLILLIIFIAQNSSKVSIHFLGFSGHLSIGLTILISAVVGVLITAVPGSIRILQLRRALKKNATAARSTG